MKTEDIVKYLLIAAGAYLVWEYVISPMMNAPAAAPAAGTSTSTSSTGTDTTSGTTTSSGAPPPPGGGKLTGSLPPVNTQISAPQTLQALLTAAAGNPQFGLNVDQWSYYYAQLPGRTSIPANTFNTIMSNLDITNATRSTALIDAQQFVGALSSVGLSGVGQTIKTNLRGGFSGRRPNAFSGSGGGAGRRLQTIH